jgi:hypothetical protein
MAVAFAENGQESAFTESSVAATLTRKPLMADVAVLSEVAMGLACER